MSDEELLRAYDAQMREDPPAEFGQWIERSSTVVRTRGRSNTILFSRIEASDVARIVGEQVAYFAALGEDVEWKVFAHDVPSSLESSLASRNFEPDESETLMVRDLASQDDLAVDVSEFQVLPVTTQADIDAYVAVTERAFDKSSPTSVADLASRFLREESETIGYLVTGAGRAVAAGRLDLPSGRSFASIWSGGTDPDFRHRGFYRTLVLGRAREARERGYRYLTVDARETSRPILERLGFRALTTVTAWNRRADPTAPRR
jgi:ribosomal protein S18 acetylase RimI-like enzyme